MEYQGLTHRDPLLRDANTQTEPIIENIIARIETLETDRVSASIKIRELRQSLMLVVIAIVAVVVGSRMGLPHGALSLTDYLDPTVLMPFYLLWATGLSGSLISLIFFSPAKLKNYDEIGDDGPPTWSTTAKKFGSESFRLAKVVMVIFTLCSVGYDTYIAHQELQSAFPDADPFAIAWWSLNLFCAKAASSPILGSACEIFALWFMSLNHSIFIRAHSRTLHRVHTINPFWLFRHLIQINGPIGASYFGLGLVFVPLGILVLAFYVLPIFIAYFWFFGPVCWIMVECARKAKDLIKCVYFKRYSTDRYRVEAYGVVMEPRGRTEAQDVRFILGRRTASSAALSEDDWKAYEEMLDCFYATGLNESAWFMLVMFVMVLPTLISMTVVIGVRLYTGNEYVQALNVTIFERHWSTYISHEEDVTFAAAAAFGLV